MVQSENATEPYARREGDDRDGLGLAEPVHAVDRLQLRANVGAGLHEEAVARRGQREPDRAGAQRQREDRDVWVGREPLEGARLGPGRIVVSEIDGPNMLANLV